MNQIVGKPEAAETWNRKAISNQRRAGDRVGLAKSLSNLAELLRRQLGRLAEARKLGEESLGLKKSLDPGAAGIWKARSILAKIAVREADAEPDLRRKEQLLTEAREQRRLARDAKRRSPGTRRELRRREPLISSIISAVHDVDVRLQGGTV